MSKNFTILACYLHWKGVSNEQSVSMNAENNTAPPAAPPDDGKPWILVVDDSRVVRKSIIHVLGAEYHVLEAGDGQAGWRMLRQNSRIEVVISDIQMPEMDGYALICKVRGVEDPGLREVPIVVITSAEDDITRERAYACGANDFILKPFNADQLTACVRAQLSEARRESLPITQAPAAPVQKPATNVVPIVVADTTAGTVETALEHIDAGLDVLRGLKTATIAPHALALVLRFLPLLKYCNAKFSLGMDREIAVFQQRIAAVHAAQRQASSAGTGSR